MCILCASVQVSLVYVFVFGIFASLHIYLFIYLFVCLFVCFILIYICVYCVNNPCLNFIV